MKPIHTLFVGALALTLTLGSAAFAAEIAAKVPAARQRPLAKMLGERLGKLKELKEELNLTPEQKEQVKEILKSHKDEITTAVKAVMEKRKALHEAATAATPDESAIRAAAADLGKAIADAALVRSKVHAEIAKVLTPDQLEKLKKFRAEHQSAMEHGVDGALGDLGKDF